MLPALFRPKKKYALACLLTGLIISTSLKAQIQAGFTADKTAVVVPRLPLIFPNTSTGNITGASYRWDFGNGNVSTLPSPSAVFMQEQPWSTVTFNG